MSFLVLQGDSLNATGSVFVIALSLGGKFLLVECGHLLWMLRVSLGITQISSLPISVSCIVISEVEILVRFGYWFNHRQTDAKWFMWAPYAHAQGQKLFRDKHLRVNCWWNGIKGNHYQLNETLTRIPGWKKKTTEAAFSHMFYDNYRELSMCSEGCTYL